jgi:CubicO group peptidase (beta-lactamase class C family)
MCVSIGLGLSSMRGMGGGLWILYDDDRLSDGRAMHSAHAGIRHFPDGPGALDSGLKGRFVGSPSTGAFERLDTARDQLISKMPALADKYGVPGAQLAIHVGGQTTTVEHGSAADGSADKVVRDTAFPVGSITKCFTATAAMALVADGDLELDEPIGGYLSGLDSGCRRITLRQLLSHTSGFGVGATPGTVSATWPSRYVAGHCRESSLLLTPGTGFSYSNAGFVLAGRLIEVVTGMSFWEALEAIVLEPLGVAPAFIKDPRAHRPVRQAATGYSVDQKRGRIRPVEQALAAAEAPAGGLLCSAADLIALGRLHTDGSRLLPAGEAELMRTPVPGGEPFGLASGWGLGIATFRCADGVWFGHDGNAHGTSCYLRFRPDSGLILAFTSNANTGIEVWRELLDELGDVGVPVERPPVPQGQPVSVATPSDFTGTYYNGDVAYVVNADDTGGLHLAVGGVLGAGMTCFDDLTFSVFMPTSDHEEVGRFLPGPSGGPVEGLQISGRLAMRREGSRS